VARHLRQAPLNPHTGMEPSPIRKVNQAGCKAVGSGELPWAQVVDLGKTRDWASPLCEA